MEDCAIYIRFSRENGRETTGRNQLDQISFYMLENNLRQYRIYENEEIEQLLSDAEEGKFRKVIITNMDRISRRSNEVLNFLNKLKEYNIELILTEVPTNTLNPHLFHTICNFEAEMIRNSLIQT